MVVSVDEAGGYHVLGGAYLLVGRISPAQVVILSDFDDFAIALKDGPVLDYLAAVIVENFGYYVFTSNK